MSHAAEDATCPWPQEIRQLYRHVAGADDRRGMLLLPHGFELLGCRSSVIDPSQPTLIVQR